MNRSLHRLVFSRRLGACVAVAETASACGKSASGERRSGSAAAVLAGLLAAPLAVQAQTAAAPPPAPRPAVFFASKLAAPVNPLPQPYATVKNADGTLRNDPSDPAKARQFVANPAQRGQVKWTVDGRQAVLDQGSVEKLVLNWDSFDIAAGYSVHFKQDKDPAKYVTALNRIWSADPSVILGRLTADREVILLNSNGVYFGRGAVVDTGKFIATSLSIADSVFEKGLRNVTDGSAVFTTAGSDYQSTNLDGAVTVEAGAEIRVAAGGDVLLLAPRVVNQGRIEAPRGQAVLAAGDKVYLMSSSDPAQRGLIVAVDPVLKDFAPDAELGTVENAASGSFQTTDATGKLVSQLNEIRAESGSINLVGLAVRQNGVLNATTAVKGANGVITLQAMASTQNLIGGAATTPAGLRGYSIETGASVRAADRLGSVSFGAGSVTAVTPDAGKATQLDAETFNRSRLRAEGRTIVVEGGARIDLPSGRIELLAAETAGSSPLFNAGALSAPADASRIVIGSGATLNVAGLRDVAVDGARNQGSQRLFRIELADAPVQQGGPLYRAQVHFDVREASKIAAANVSGAAAAITRTAAERSTLGGTLMIGSEGALLVDQGSRLDVSGGSLKFSETTIAKTLVQGGGVLGQFSLLAAGNRIDGLAGEQRLVSPAYTEGKAGGTLSLQAQQLLLAGTLRGEVLQGERQRDGRDARAAAASLEIGSVRAGQLALTRLQLGSASAGFGEALRANPLGASLADLPATQLSLADVQAAGFGTLKLHAQEIRQLAFGQLDLGAGGRLEMNANRLQLDGSFQAAGGTIKLTTLQASDGDAATRLGDISLSARTRLDAAGRWSNDSAGSANAGVELVQIKGGEVAVSAAHSLLAEAGSVIDVSAGARLSASGSLSFGTAGAISLSSGRQEFFATTLQIAGLQLRGFDFASGGSLSVGAPSLQIGPGAEGFALAPEFFSAGGFGNISVNAFGDILLRSGLDLQPQLLNWQLAEGSRQAASGAMSATVVTAQRLDATQLERKPVSLALNASRPLTLVGSSLTVERGASVKLDPGATLSLSATRNLSVGEQGGNANLQSYLSARGGQILLQLQGQRGGTSSTPDPIGFLADQALWIGDAARLDVSGIALLRPDTSTPTVAVFGAPVEGPRVTGTVLGGGTIALQAARGYVVVEQGSRLNLDGAVATINLPGSGQPTTLARSAGKLVLSSPEGFVLQGAVSARAPQGADGGKLDLQIASGGVEAATAGPAFPGFDANGLPSGVAKPRELRLGSDAGLADGLALGDDLFAALDNGIGHVSTALLTESGFAGFNLGAGDRIRFASDLTLQAGLSLRLDAPVLLGDAGVTVDLRAASASLGDHSANRVGAAPDRSASASTAGADGATLRLQAAALDIVGIAGLQGFARTELVADGAAPGAIRFLSRAYDAQGRAGLNFADTLVLAAGQIHAASFTEGLLTGTAAASAEAAGSRLEIRHATAGADTRIPLAAQGGLTFSATTIDQGGTLLQPYGRISLQAERELLLRDGSLTSISSLGQLRLAGSTSNLTDWRAAFGQTLTTLAREPGVQLKAQHIAADAGAVVRASGGGDLLAYEFFPGVGGSADYFETEGLYAVLPDFATGNNLPFDGNGSASDALQSRELVVTMGGSGLAPGRYTLLPARYALLAGALPQGGFLVRMAKDQGKTTLSAPLRQDDGSTVITAYQTEAGAMAAGLPGERWVVEAPATYRARSEVRLSSVNSLLGQVAADSGALRAPSLPRDAGLVQIVASGAEPGRWEAALQLAAADGGRAGLLDVSASALALIDGLAKPPAGSLSLDADLLAASGAGSVLLGGTRSLDAASQDAALAIWKLDTSATRSLLVDLGDKTLVLEELLLGASEQISLADGTRIDASRHGDSGSLGARQFSASGDGALAFFSRNRLGLTRSGALLAGGSLRVGENSRLSGEQLLLDATGQLAIAASSALNAQALALGARALDIGLAASPDEQATVLAGSLLATARAAPELLLRAYDGIRFAGVQGWAGRDASGSATHVQSALVLDAPRISGVADASGAAAAVDLAAQSVSLRNSTGREATGATLEPGSGTLRIEALPPLQYGQTGGLTLGPGTLQLGFADAALRSLGDIVLSGSGETRAQGDLLLAAARITAESAAQQAVRADAGRLRLEQQAGSRSLGETVGLGASLSLSAQTLVQGAQIELAGGQLELLSRGTTEGEAALQLLAGSRISVAGPTLDDGEGHRVHGQAGRISLRAEQGAIQLLGTLDASAAAQGDAGEISLSAVGSGGDLQLGASSRLLARAGSGDGDLGGSLQVDLNTLADAAALFGAAQGFERQIELRVRSGDLRLADLSLRAQAVNLSADAGSLLLDNSRIDARAASGGVVALSAGGDVRLLGTTQIDARSLRSGANGGDVLLASGQGRVGVAASARIDASGDSAGDGRIVLRAQRGADASSVAVDTLTSSQLLAGDVAIEAVREYSQVGSGSSARAITAIASGNSVASSGTLGQTAVRNDSNAFMANAGAVLDSLGVSGDERVRLSAGVEVRASGDLRVTSDWALNAERPGGEAGFLSLRAAGNLDINGSLSDGFTTATASGLLQANAESWSMRLVAGADLGAANLLATRSALASGSAESGNLTVAAGRLVRTGAGSIDLAAARDLRFAAGSANTAGGAAYVAGRQLAGEAEVLASLFAGQSAKPKFSEQGGRLTLSAGRDVTAGAATQLINNWHWRSGLLDSADPSRYARSSQLAWWNEFAQFRQTLGSFGGGDLRVNAGRDLVNVQAMLPSSGYADSALIADARLRVLNGGELQLQAGRDVLGGQYFVATGSGRLTAGGAIRASNGLEALLALSDGADWRLQARGDLQLAAAINPSAFSTPTARNAPSGVHYRWGEGAAVRASSLTGELALRSGYAQSTVTALGLSAGATDGNYLAVTAPRLELAALQGDLTLARALVLAPAADGQLSAWAGGDLTISAPVAMSDFADWPSAFSPVAFNAETIKGTAGLVALTLNGAAAYQGLHAGDAEGSWLLAGGTLSMPSSLGALRLAEATLLRAGEDIRDLRFSTQHTRADELTRIEAGSSLFASAQDGLIELFGPGALAMAAGRSIDLGASQGVRTSGNLRNAALPAQGASLSLTAATSGSLSLTALRSQYLSDTAEGGSPRAAVYRQLLLDFVRDALRSPELDFDAAWQQFQAFPASAQAVFGRQLLAREFGAVYLEPQAPASADYLAQLALNFESRKADLLKAVDAALAGTDASLLLPGNEELKGAALLAYRETLLALSVDRLDLAQIGKDRSASLAAVQSGWQESSAASVGRTLAEIAQLRSANPADATVLAYDAALTERSGARFERYRESVLRSEIAGSATAAAQFGLGALPARLALYDEGFRVAELAGAGNFAGSPVWPVGAAQAALFDYQGNLNLTQSAVLTQRGGDISLRNAGGAINVGLKDGGGAAGRVKGVIALGGGNVFGFARDDFQVNTQRVFIVGKGNMTLWSSAGDIDSGRGANTAVAAPPLAARRSVDGVVFETQATTTGSGLGILEDVNGRREGSAGLFAAQGEILALDALIRAPALVLGSTVKGADNLVAASVGGAAAPVAPPTVSVSPPPANNNDRRDAAALDGNASKEERQRSGLLTVELLGLGSGDEECADEGRDDKGRCRIKDAKDGKEPVKK